MSAIEAVAVYDDRVVSKRPKFGVNKGALSNTVTPFYAISNNGSQQTYQIQIPSESTYVDRAIQWNSTCYLQFTVTSPNVVLNQPVVNIGVDFASSAFPLHRLCQTLSATINNTTVTVNEQDVINEITRLVDSKKNRSKRTCPTYLDTYANYNDAYLTNRNPLAGFNNSSSDEDEPNGAFYGLVFTNPAGTPLTGSGSYIYQTITYNYVNGIPVGTNNTASPPALITVYPLFVSIRSTEQLQLSPFTWSECQEWDSALFGIQNIALIMNFNTPSFTGLNGRVLRVTEQNGKVFSALDYNRTVVQPFGDSLVYVTTLTPPLDLPLPVTNFVPFMEFPRYVFSNAQTVPAKGSLPAVPFQTVTLSSIPDYLILMAKPTNYAKTDADYYLPITQVSINWDNNSGILSSYNTQNLYSISSRNGVNMSYNQWIGSANNSTSNSVALSGGFVILKLGVDIPLATGQCAGLNGNYTFSANVTVNNQTSSSVVGFNLWLVAVNSGFFQSQKGSSLIIKSPVTSKEVLDAPLAGYVTRKETQRMVGGGFFDSLANAFNKVKDFVSQNSGAIKSVVSAAKPLLPSEAQQVLGAVGLGKTGKMRTMRLKDQY
ncbi:MAG: phage major capsid domain-containing protein [Terrimicrobiaceae bacterium]